MQEAFESDGVLHLFWAGRELPQDWGILGPCRAGKSCERETVPITLFYIVLPCFAG